MAQQPAAATPWMLLAVVGAAWAALVASGASPEAPWLDHDIAPQGAGAQLLAGAAFAAGWVLMTAAMMLGSASGLPAAFGRTVRRRPDGGVLVALVVGGFLAAWLVVGWAFRNGDLAVHAAVDALPWLEARTEVLSGGALVLAGLGQFSAVKRRCLTACRAPPGFVYRPWGHGHPRRDAAAVGRSYGWSCAGCCWALMLLLFAVGMTNGSSLARRSRPGSDRRRKQARRPSRMSRRRDTPRPAGGDAWTRARSRPAPSPRRPSPRRPQSRGWKRSSRRPGRAVPSKAAGSP